MKKKLTEESCSILYIAHGGGPLPLLGDKSHQSMISSLQEITSTLAKPSAILVISAHWEADKVTITSGKNPSLIYDYNGFPDEAYQFKYPAPGDPVLAEKIFYLLKQNGIEAELDEQRGFDHGLFVPLKIMFPEADIPCIQLSLVNSLDPIEHIKIGEALSELKQESLLIIGSGMSFHNMKGFYNLSTQSQLMNKSFEEWLTDTCSNHEIDRTHRLENWGKVSSARYCHPREEHLLPLHVCYGVSKQACREVFELEIMNKKVSMYLW